MIILGITLILAVANIIDLTIRVNYKNDKNDKKDEPTHDENDN